VSDARFIPSFARHRIAAAAAAAPRRAHASHASIMGSVFGKITEEQPEYAVVPSATGGTEYEVRKYAPCCVIETTYASARGMVRGDQGGSFMRLAGYIGVLRKPENEKKEKISMTAPVFMQPESDATKFTMQFVLPKSKFPNGASDAPKPTDANVRVLDVGERWMAVRRFAGRMNEELIAKESAVLKSAIERDGLVRVVKHTDVAQYAGYNPPWTPGMMRTNEVMYEIESPAA
jgi:hypothetical protein